MKRRPVSHVTDTAGVNILRKILPTEWVVREYRPDYGIDFDVEVFDFTVLGELVSLGEHFFIQLKSRSRVETIELVAYPHYNIEKQPFQEDYKKEVVISCIPVQLSVSDLLLARSMGPALPVLLVLCDTANETLHFVCLNDYVDKIVIPSDPQFASKDSMSVYIPVCNFISATTTDLLPLRFFARRAKLYAAFNRLRYQRHELTYVLDGLSDTPYEDIGKSEAIVTIQNFIEIVKGYDFWETTRAWPAIELTWQSVIDLEKTICRCMAGEDPVRVFGERHLEKQSLEVVNPSLFLASEIENTWNMLANLGNIFEEYCRERFLPTYLNAFLDGTSFRTKRP
jgi:hypothetical protein